ncbi:acyl-CoA (8-3)-desaturase [Aplysia californica]|uniref:Acyl-CoA (8-3)-desaturase n=1 Tax=Aplysia californica TaxID=6500 RepID=A0ABM1W2I4_APLCA|nr:acyl-CoA (8-3)-desaturase [Aplysia californica]
MGDTLPVEKAKQTGRGWSVPYNLQSYYFFILGPPVTIGGFWPFVHTYHLLKRKNLVETLTVLAFYVHFGYLFGPMLGFWGTAKLLFMAKLCEGTWFITVSEANHGTLGVEYDAEDSWVEMHLKRTCNLGGGAFKSWGTGHLNYQIEHHLFPTLPRHNLHKVVPFVQSLCKKHGIYYCEKTFTQAVIDIVKSLRESGDLWSKTRAELFG